MRCRLAPAVFVFALTAWAQTMSVAQLKTFIESSIQLKQKDKEVAGTLSHMKMTERLDDRTVEDLQGLGIGPRTLAALRVLRDESKGLEAAAPAAPEVKPKPIPPPSPEEQAALITEARQYALNYSQSLPDFICTQVTRRYASATPGGRYDSRNHSDNSWQLQDTLTIRLSYFNQREDYKLILVNNTVSQQDYKKLSGAVSTGEFGSMLRDIFQPETEARFDWDHWATLRGRRALAFAYRVTQPHSEWQLDYEHQQQMRPAYDGLVYIDRETHQILRVTMATRDIPPSFPIHQAETVLDYDYQTLSSERFLLPLHADSRMKTSDLLSRLDEEFHLYRKFSSESEIKYDTPEPLPSDQTQEQPVK